MMSRWRFDMRTHLAGFDQEAPSASSSSGGTAGTMHVSLEYPASGETQDRLGSVLVQKSSQVDDGQISALDAFHEMEWTKESLNQKCWIGIEEKTREISREVKQMNWLRT